MEFLNLKLECICVNTCSCIYRYRCVKVSVHMRRPEDKFSVIFKSSSMFLEISSLTDLELTNFARG